ncbi:MAG TPA: hypothetical protein VGJ93_05790 [Desulfuromonadaceae bacterium]|jgi:uncharacterized membrane protein
MFRKLIFIAPIIILGAAPLLAEEPKSGANLGSVQGGEFKSESALSIIKEKCTRCHSSQRIDAAFSAKKDMLKIQQEMEKKGARLSDKERNVMGIYWSQNPLKQK